MAGDDSAVIDIATGWYVTIGALVSVCLHGGAGGRRGAPATAPRPGGRPARPSAESCRKTISLALEESAGR